MGSSVRASVCCGAMLSVLLGGCSGIRTIVAPSKPAADKVDPVAPVLSPDLSPEEAERLSRGTRARIEATEELVRPLDGKAFSPDQAETYATIQSFLAKAKEALHRRDLQRASTLADKAHILADELVQTRH